MGKLDETMFFDFGDNKPNDVRGTLKTVYDALEEKGYNPIDQIVGYLISGDPAYIPVSYTHLTLPTNREV